MLLGAGPYQFSGVLVAQMPSCSILTSPRSRKTKRMTMTSEGTQTARVANKAAIQGESFVKKGSGIEKIPQIALIWDAITGISCVLE